MTAKGLTFVFSTLLLVTGCSKSEVVTSYPEQVAKQDYSKQQPVQQEVNNNPVPVVFDVVTGNQATTRVVINNETNLQSSGFGVFAYYTHNDNTISNGYTSNGLYSSTTTPNFMYNERVEWSDKWRYNPLKYWPNDYSSSDVDSQSAIGSKTSKVSFFAYAPWVDVTPTTGVPTSAVSTGITKISENSATGDPIITYSIANNTTISSSQQDLLYAVVPETYYNHGTDGTTNKTFNPGDQYIDLVKPQLTDQPINFGFQHAVARFDLEVTGVFDEESRTSDPKLIDDNTFIKLESVIVKVAPNKATFNLRTKTWTKTNDASTGSFNLTASDIISTLRYTGDETYVNLSHGVGRDVNGTKIPATKTVKDEEDHDVVLNPNPDLNQKVIDGGNYFLFIPVNKEGVDGGMDFEVTVKYHVFTKDVRMFNQLAHVENEIVNTVTIPRNQLVAGGTYSIIMMLGLTSVKFNLEQITDNNPKDGYWTTVDDGNKSDLPR